MDTSGSEDEDFIIKRAPVIIVDASASNSDHNDDLPVTPPMDHSLKLNRSLGLIMSPQSPPYRKVRSMKLFETPRSNLMKIKLDAPCFTSTPAASPCVAKISRSLKVQRSKSKFDIKEKLNLTCGNVPRALVNPYSPYNHRSRDPRQHKKSRMEKGRNEFDSDESECDDDISFKDLKKPKLSDFDTPRFEKEFAVLGILGAGDHGCVYHCFHYLTGMEYAVKRSLGPVNNERVARNEIFAHAVLEHPYIVRNFVSWTEDDYVFMQNEYCKGGSLEDHIKNKGPLQEKELMVLLEHCAQGLRYIHQCNLAHMDIKPGNIFLQISPKLFIGPTHLNSNEEEDSLEETYYKIGDLGHVIPLDNTGCMDEGDCRYFPRDILNDANLNYTKVDIFSLGLTLYEAAGGGPLPKNGDQWHRIRDGHIKTFSHLSSQFNNILKKMVDPEPENRPSASDLLHEIFRDEVMKDRELKASYHRIHLLEHQISDFKNVLRSSHGKKLATNNINSIASTPGRYTRSTSRLAKKNSTLN